MGSITSRRLRRRRDLQDIAVRRAQWQLRFYCWRWFILLIPATFQVGEAVVAVLDGRAPHLLLDIPSWVHGSDR